MMNAKYTVYALLLLISAVLLSACGDKNKNSTQSQQNVSLPGDETVLVKVNGSTISAYDFEQQLLRMLGELQASMLDENGRKKALESMAASRAIAQTMEQELSAQELAKIEREVAALREKLLVNRYLKTHSDVQPVTQEMVKAYYEQNPEKYGAKTVRRFEMVFSEQQIPVHARKEVLDLMSQLKDQTQWNAAVTDEQQQKYSLRYRSGVIEEGLLNEQLLLVMQSLSVGQVSDVTFIQGKPYIVRILSEQQRPARPIQEVSTEVRRALAPMQMKKAVKQASEKVLKTAKVEYVGDTQ